ncbi:Ff.00g022740.m01.CDS01 [Fusarium sp. VM40]|nr:Ff.00g022740.m01.CDS01 [Fusarium sp. VM40]
MDSLTIHKTETHYYQFTEGPARKSGVFNRRVQPYVTITDEDGSIAYEELGLGLMAAIVRQDDTRALKEYLTNASWLIPRAPAIPPGLEEYSTDIDYFHYAVHGGRLGVLKMLLAHGTGSEDPNPPTKIRFKEREYELLHIAARCGHLDMVKFLLENQPLYADIHEQDFEGFSPIISAADCYPTDYLTPGIPGKASAARNEAVINLLLDRGASASDVVPPMAEADKTSDTVLTLAAKWAGSALLERLIERGADVHAKVTKLDWQLTLWNSPGKTFEVDALFIACSVANFDAVKTLIDYSGVHTDAIHSRDSRGSLPIHWATQNAVADGMSAFSAAIQQEKVQNITSIIGHLLDLDPTTVNAQDNIGNTPLQYATRAFGRHDELYSPVFKLICDRGGDSSIRNDKGQTPLHTLFECDGVESDRVNSWCGTIAKDEPVIETSSIITLLAHGAKATDVDDDGNTPLHYVAEILDYVNAVSVLLDHGADPTRRNSKQETALHRAARGHYRPMDRWFNAEDRIEAQEDVMARLIKVGGEGLMDQIDAKGNCPRQLSEEQRNAWRKDDGPAWKRPPIHRPAAEIVEAVEKE